MKENDENWLETIYRDNDFFDTDICVSEAKCLLELYFENGRPEEMSGLVERILMEGEKLGIDFE